MMATSEGTGRMVAGAASGRVDASSALDEAVRKVGLIQDMAYQATREAREIADRIFGSAPESDQVSKDRPPVADGTIYSLDHNLERLGNMVDELRKEISRLRGL